MKNDYTETISPHDANSEVTPCDQDIRGMSWKLWKESLINHETDLGGFVFPSYRKEITEELERLRKELKRPVIPIERYAKTKHAAAYLDVDPSFLDKKRKDGVFKLGIHYYRPPDCSLVLWDIEALSQWVKSEGADDEYRHIVEQMLS